MFQGINDDLADIESSKYSVGEKKEKSSLGQYFGKKKITESRK